MQSTYHTNQLAGDRRSYYAVVPTATLLGEHTVIDELIGFAFDKLGVVHLDVRVYDEQTAVTALPDHAPSRFARALIDSKL